MNNSSNCSGGLRMAPGRGITMPVKLSACAVILVSCFYACGPAKEEMDYREASKAVREVLNESMPGLATDTINGISHNFIRTADIKFQVNDVLAASNQIEDLVIKKGGYITNSDLSSSITYSTSIQFKKDSLLESVHYTTINTMKLRVPNKQLDSALRAISNLAGFINSRRLTADDVKMSLYANQLAENRYKNYQSAVKKKTATSGNTLKDNVDAQQELLDKQTLIDNASMDSYDLADKVNYSTITLELYQPEKVHTEIKATVSVPGSYVPSFFEKLSTAFLQGSELLKNCVLFLVSIWGLLAFLLLIIFTWKKAKVILGKLQAGLK